MALTLPRGSARANLSEERRETSRFPTCSLNVTPIALKTPYLYHGYFCMEPRDTSWGYQLIDILEKDHKFVCVEYLRDFRAGGKVLDLITKFLFTSEKIVMVMSENFVSANWAKYQLHLAVHYNIDHNLNNIVVLHIDDCIVPPQLLPFERISTLQGDWMDKLVGFLMAPAHVSMNDICCDSLRSTMSDPPTLRAPHSLVIPEDIRTKIKIWYRSKSFGEFRSQRRMEDLFCEDAASCDKNSADNQEEEFELENPSPDADSLASLRFMTCIRSRNKTVYEVNQPQPMKRDGKLLPIKKHDILERVDETPIRGNLYQCRNMEGKEGLVAEGLMSPSWYILPAKLIQKLKQPIPSDENNLFKNYLESSGLSYSVAVRDKNTGKTDLMQLNIRTDDVLLRISAITGGRAMFRNCRNETGYVSVSAVRNIEVSGDTSRISNLSIGSQGYHSETDDI